MGILISKKVVGKDVQAAIKLPIKVISFDFRTLKEIQTAIFGGFPNKKRDYKD